MMRDTSKSEETLIAATVSLLAEGAAVLIFFLCVIAWLAIFDHERKASFDERWAAVELRR